MGTGAYPRGVDSTFDLDDKGICFLRAEGDQPRIVRSVVGLNSLVAERIASVARDMREAAGRLTGEAAGEEMAAEEFQVDLLGDRRDVLDGHPAHATSHLVTLVAALAELRPALYGHLAPAPGERRRHLVNLTPGAGVLGV